MSAAPTQQHRALAVTTPLGTDTLLLTEFHGSEGLSRLFQFQLNLLAEARKEVAFDKVLGQAVTVRLETAGGNKRFFNGICNSMAQGEGDGDYVNYRLEMVPRFWLLTKRAQSRIFQHQTVPQILKKVLDGLDVNFELQGTFQPRDYCVQYRETDFNFACRLMEEEGIYYYFVHGDGTHKMTVANTPGSHVALPGGSKLTYKHLSQSVQDEDQIYDWSKVQDLTAGKYTLWDHSFELPHKHLEAEKGIVESVQVGQASHKLRVGDNGKLEIYDFPGEYAQRFDGIASGGGDQPAELQKIFEDNARTVNLRMQQEAAGALAVRGASNVRHMASGYKFTLATVSGDPLTQPLKADGDYVITALTHTISYGGNYRAGSEGSFEYRNSFAAIPLALPFRPQRVAAKPVVAGSQTAVVVGPAGEEIFCDKYSRVKVQFHWDRQGKHDAGSSCWVRVSTLWAGKQWGMIYVPRIGQEVIVDFLEGDPDQPIIVGSVYNADMMPPYKLPDHKTQSGVKTRSSLKGTEQNFNEIRFEDKKGDEQLFIHAEKNQDIEVEHDETHWVGHDRQKTIDRDETTQIKRDRTETVDRNEMITIKGDRTEEVKKDESITIVGGRTETVKKDERVRIDGDRTQEVGKSESLSVAENRSVTIGKNDDLTVGKVLVITAGDEITFKTGDASIIMRSSGDILISGKNIKLTGTGKIDLNADGDVKVKGSKIAHN
jgi:type VI secretion system secreted protein VgrG